MGRESDSYSSSGDLGQSRHSVLQSVLPSASRPSTDNPSARPQPLVQNDPARKDPLGRFGKFLWLWVALCMAAGTAIGALWPQVASSLARSSVNEISLPVTILLWIMIYPMMLKIEWTQIKKIVLHPKAIGVTVFTNWAVQPFFMYALAVLFFRVFCRRVLSDKEQTEFVAGAVLLGGAPCTAMVFVWSALAQGDPTYTLVQVCVNDLILLVLYVPTAVFLLGLSDIALPWDTVFMSVALFLLVPAAAGILTRVLLLRSTAHGLASVERLAARMEGVTGAALLVTIVFIFIFQGSQIVHGWSRILLIAIPLTLQTFAIAALAYGLCYWLRIEHSLAGPAAFIGSSNFFELAVAIAITVYGLDSGAVLVTVVGVLTEVPTMLCLVFLVKHTKPFYERRVVHFEQQTHSTLDELDVENMTR